MDGGYFPVNHCVSNVETITSNDLHLMVDNKTRTCVNTYIMQHGVGLSLKVSFSFPISGFEMKFLSIEVVLQGSIDCKSITLTWFVGSNSSSDKFRECRKGLIVQDTNFTSCLVTCSCMPPCVKIHLQNELAFFAEKRVVSLCEVIFRPGSIIPGAKNGSLTTHFMISEISDEYLRNVFFNLHWASLGATVATK